MEPGRDAWDLVKQVWMTKGPGRITLPVDPVAISFRLEIKVFDDDELPPDMSGVVRKEAEFKNPEIFLNESDSFDRQRFTCAHALGHYSRNVEVGRDEESGSSSSLGTCSPLRSVKSRRSMRPSSPPKC